MTRIIRIQTFLEDYKSLDPYLKEICKEMHHHFQLELIKEYLKVSKHPYPNECLDIT